MDATTAVHATRVIRRVKSMLGEMRNIDAIVQNLELTMSREFVGGTLIADQRRVDLQLVINGLHSMKRQCVAAILSADICSALVTSNSSSQTIVDVPEDNFRSFQVEWNDKLGDVELC